MSLSHTAEYLKKHGRGPDDQLVHMSSNELRGLQKLAKSAGGSLTVNPHTGLPEAGFLDSILPMVIGAGLSVASGGALTPLMAAGITGLGYGVAKHDLGAGLQAGLSAFGGAGLSTGLATAGADAIASEAANTTNAGVQSQLANAGELQSGLDLGTSPSSFVPGAQNVGSAVGPQATTASQGLDNAQRGLSELGTSAGRSAAMTAMPQGTLPAAGYAVANALSPQPTVPNQLESPDSNPMGFARLSKDFKGYQPQQPNPYYKAQYQDYTQNPYAPKQMADGGLAAPNAQGPVEQMSNENAGNDGASFQNSGLNMASGSNRFQSATSMPTSSSMISPTDAMTDTYTGAMKMASGGAARELLGQMYDPAMDEFKRETDVLNNLRDKDYINPFHLASGGHLSSSASIPDTGVYHDTNLTTKGLHGWNAAQAGYKQIAKRANIKAGDMPKTGIESLAGNFSDTGASGGIATLGSYSDGGRLLKGPGDGMSDNIPAQIGKHQPARLADGEFVVPADVVSHLGNGSTEAGAKKLYNMMDKVRKARTGRKAQGKQINPNKFLPA